MDKKIRPISIALISKDNKYLVIKGYDSKKDEVFYRPLGGGIEFGETGEEALAREMREELDTELVDIKYISMLENIFVYEGNKMHELVLVYSAEFKDKDFYDKDDLIILDSVKKERAYWISKDELKKSRFYPEGIEKHI